MDNDDVHQNPELNLTAPDGGLSALNRILRSLRDEHRRYLLYFLEEERSCSLEKAACNVAAEDLECDLEDVPAEVQTRIENELYHVHLPMLADLNIIDFDERSRALQLHDPPNGFDDFLDLAREQDEGD